MVMDIPRGGTISMYPPCLNGISVERGKMYGESGAVLQKPL